MYRVPVLERFSWQDPVIAFVDQPTQSTKGSRFIVSDSAINEFAGHEGEIAWHDGTTWQFDVPAEGWKIFNKNDKEYYTYKNSSWDSQSTVEFLDLDGDVDSTDVEVDWDLRSDVSEALSFDSTSMVGILSIDTTDGAEGVNMAGDLAVQGNLTVQGTMTTIESQTVTIEDKLLTLNKGGPAGSGNNTGIEFEEDDNITGYVKVKDGDRTILALKAPGGNILELDTNADVTLSMSGNLTVESDSVINQDVTTDADVNFNGVTAN